LYPALYRLEVQGLLDAEWGTLGEQSPRQVLPLTPAGRKRLRAETESWNRSASAVATALGAKPREV
jgi:PadR family transcriptional regulator, regulatory protein PadR